MVTVSEPTLNALAERVQDNCDISDAHFARDYTMCIYLLKMREYFRWERGYDFTDSLPKEELGEWLTAREQRWEGLEGEPYRPLEIGGEELDPFDNATANAALAPYGLVYSGGIGGFAKPHFFLAELERDESRGERRILVAGREYARDITAPPAMSQGNLIFIRRESMRRAIWEKVESWQWQQREQTPMGRAIAHYPFADDFDRALDRMTDDELEMVLLHEVGELQAGRELGTQWESMLLEVARSRTELVCRAVRDHLADCLSTLPTLLEREAIASLHFYFGNLHGMRRELFPALLEAYERWLRDGQLEHIAAVAERGREHWAAVARELLVQYQEKGPAMEPDTAELAL